MCMRALNKELFFKKDFCLQFDGKRAHDYGGGGSQRLPRYVGKSLAMEMILTGDMISAAEAKEAGLISKIFEKTKLLDEAIKTADKISQKSPIIVSMAKKAVNEAYESTLSSGLEYERSLFYATFSTVIIYVVIDDYI
ncbi:hypothetical protein A3Q56_06525 [Intoshia linei]|uniref:enoyl-CoA hydratase n=1 Tax=Intoshia linei TaxID=1819745 RepID=A0A177AX48_9BILA|nr:hypothetical protein A3Q56_06525 [Intoshia linei]